MIINTIKILLPTTLTFLIGIALTPMLTNYMYKHKLWKKKLRTEALDITNDEFGKIHNGTAEISTPRVGGIVIWLSALVCVAIMWSLSKIFPFEILAKFDFFSKSQTLIPLASLILGSVIGLFDDYVQIKGGDGRIANDDIKFRYSKIFSILFVGVLIALWFYFKLGITSIAVPFSQIPLELGILFIPFFVLVMVATYSTSIIDGLDGLAGGVLGIIFGAYAAIAFGKNMIDIAALSGVISGGILAFLWFNIPPARFYMGETGIVGLMVILTVIAFLTDTVLILPLIALPLVATTLSAIIQITSYKYFGKRRVFKIAPLHHHFRAIGWSSEKVVMRYWVVSVVCALLGVVLALISR